MNAFPLDYESIPEGGLERWHEKFFLPCSPFETFKMFIAIREALYDCVKRNQGSLAGDLLLAEIKLYLDFSSALCGLHFVNLLKERGCEPECSPRSALAAFKAGLFAEKEPKAPPDNLIRTLKRRLRTELYNMRVNRSPFYFLNASDACGSLYNIQPTKESMAYARKMGVSYRYVSKAGWLSGWERAELTEDARKETARAAEDAAQSIARAAAGCGLRLADADAKNVFSIILSKLTDCAKQYQTLKGKFSKVRRKTHLLGANQAPSFSRLFALCVDAAGGMTTAFNHGYDPTRSRDLRIETSLAKRFVTYTKGACEEAAKSLEGKFKPLSGHMPELVSLDSSMYREIWQASSARKPSEIRSVLLPGYPYDSLYNMMWGLPELSILDLEMRIAKTLRDAGFKVIYKAHPDGVFKGSELVKDVPVGKERFEDMMMEADAFVLSYHATSVMPLALATNRRMALIHSCHLLDDYADDTMKLLKRRCEVLTPEADGRNRLRFDEEALVKCLSAPPSEPDMELLNKLMDIA